MSPRWRSAFARLHNWSGIAEPAIHDPAPLPRPNTGTVARLCLDKEREHVVRTVVYNLTVYETPQIRLFSLAQCV